MPLLLMSSCANINGIARDYCALSDYWMVSPEDTLETKRQALIHNLQYKEICE